MSPSSKEAAKLRDASLNTFKDQTDRPLDWYKTEEEKQDLRDHPAGLKSEKTWREKSL